MTSPIIDWWIRLDADEDWDIDLLIEQFRSGDCIIQRAEDGACYLTSLHFRGLQDRKRVIAAALPLLAAVNGVGKVLAPWFQSVSSDILISIHENGNRGTVILAGPIKFRVPQEIPPRDLDLDHSTGLGKAERWVRLAAGDDAVAKVLRIFGIRPPTWPNLYNLYELVREDVSDWKVIVHRGWAEEPELSRFRETANDPDVIGDDARHGRAPDTSKWDEAFQPMSHSEAQELLRKILRKWLDWKLNENK